MPPWTAVVAIGWTGMRGIVSLAAAIAIPWILPSGAEFEQRNLLIFLTYGVILVTLLLPALTLPAMKKWLRLQDGGDHHREESLARIRATEAVVERTRRWEQSGEFPAELRESFRARFERRLSTIRSNVEENAVSTIQHEDIALRRMTRESIDAERTVLAELRRGGEIHDEVFHQLAYELDIEDMRLRTQRL
jgi:CPA1 family monovalent cation:H+ antiporter